jgi:hypothetical protein
LTFVIVFLTTGVIWHNSIVFAIIYLIVFAGWYITIFWAYCSKCPCHSKCTHVYMGWIASKVVRTKRNSKSSTDYLVNTVLLIVLLIYPQIWLKDHFVILISFWLVMIAMGPMITPIFCPTCEHTSCPVHRLFVQN